MQKQNQMYFASLHSPNGELIIEGRSSSAVLEAPLWPCNADCSQLDLTIRNSSA